MCNARTMHAPGGQNRTRRWHGRVAALPARSLALLTSTLTTVAITAEARGTAGRVAGGV